MGILDLLELLSQWGLENTSCDSSFPTEGVGITEFLELLENWGPCAP